MVKNILDFDEFIQELDEGLLMTYPADKVIRYIQNKLYLTNEDISILYDQSEYIIVNKMLNKDVLDKIEHILVSSGYYNGGEEDDVIFYEKKFGEEVFDKLKQSGVKYLYHVSPSINDKKILSIGLIPKSKNYRFRYPDRIYFLSDKDVNKDVNFLRNICRELFKPIYINWMRMILNKTIKRDSVERRKLNEYSVYKIDTSKIENIKLYLDPNARNFDSYYTMDNIKPNCIEKIDEIKL